MSKLSIQLFLLTLGLSLFVAVSLGDLNSGVEDDDDSLDGETGGAPMKHKEEIINSLPKMPEEPNKVVNLGKLEIGIKKKVEDCKYQAQKGDKLHMHYRGFLKGSTTEFDSSYKRGEPLTFTLGAGQVIGGWDRGLLGICAGEKRVLKVPPYLGYGMQGSPPTIPPDAFLVFEVEAVSIDRAGAKEDL